MTAHWVSLMASITAEMPRVEYEVATTRLCVWAPIRPVIHCGQVSSKMSIVWSPFDSWYESVVMPAGHDSMPRALRPLPKLAARSPTSA